MTYGRHVAIPTQFPTQCPSWCPRPRFHKEFIEELECELEPLVTQTVGTTNISLLITDMPAGKHFRVEGVSVKEGFSFMVRPHCLVFALGHWVVQEELGLE